MTTVWRRLQSTPADLFRFLVGPSHRTHPKSIFRLLLSAPKILSLRDTTDLSTPIKSRSCLDNASSGHQSRCQLRVMTMLVRRSPSRQTGTTSRPHRTIRLSVFGTRLQAKLQVNRSVDISKESHLFRSQKTVAGLSQDQLMVPSECGTFIMAIYVVSRLTYLHRALIQSRFHMTTCTLLADAVTIQLLYSTRIQVAECLHLFKATGNR